MHIYKLLSKMGEGILKFEEYKLRINEGLIKTVPIDDTVRLIYKIRYHI